MIDEGIRGGAYDSYSSLLASSLHNYGDPTYEGDGGGLGFRVVSIPEPGSLVRFHRRCSGWHVHARVAM